jgi:small-conductance mechanosensitive channel
MLEFLEDPLLDMALYGNTIEQYLLAITILVATIVFMKLFKMYVLVKLKKLAEKTDTLIDDVIVESIQRVGIKFYFAVALYISLRLLVLPVFIYDITYSVMIIILSYYLIRVAIIWVEFFTKKVEDDDAGDPHSFELIAKIIKIAIWLVGIVLVLQILGYNVTTLVAGLGIGGIAIAFALQNVLSDIFASFTIYYDKPFKKGDYIVIGQDSGTVLSTGLKSTRIKTLQGDELVISNKALTDERIHNYKKMEERRINFQFGIEYGTPSKKMKKINGIIEKIFENTPNVRIHSVRFLSFGDSSLIYNVIYHVTNRDYLVYIEAQEKINYAIKDAFEKEKISMAFPTRTLHIKK